VSDLDLSPYLPEHLELSFFKKDAACEALQVAMEHGHSVSQWGHDWKVLSQSIEVEHSTARRYTFALRRVMRYGAAPEVRNL